eukprot:CAMPEP_0176148936 /NCGR_PEP_ID=MMETSP0120_2-20121206/75969_1 /TAXON_ID=160619 /ORGANISM="Kryptoperidinium foliaceum, Strain CCMP 1326" /LENGTH=38 /DNA_ID= /DNA_START= /DNA_END= /DNA_ORIENTATION=
MLQSIFIGYAAHEAFQVSVKGAAPQVWVDGVGVAFCVI